MKKYKLLSLVSITLILGLFQNCSDVAFLENPIVYKSESTEFDTSSMLDAEFYKVVLILDPSNSMNDDLVKLSAALDNVIETARGYNIRFYIYNTDSNIRMVFDAQTLRATASASSTMENLVNADFTLKDGSLVNRAITSSTLTDWSSYQFKLKAKPALATFELSKNSTLAEINTAKENLRSIVTTTYPANVLSTEYGICTLKRLIEDSGDNRILFPGDKVNFILISDENNGGYNENDERCKSGAEIIRAESSVQDQWCIAGYKGLTSKRILQKGKDCDDGYSLSKLVSETQALSISTTLGVRERAINFTYRNIDTITKSNLPRVINYNYELITPYEDSCTPAELLAVRETVRARSGNVNNLISCNAKVQNNGLTFTDGNFLIQKNSSASNNDLMAINQTFNKNHCEEDSTFFNMNNKRSYPSYRHAIADILRANGFNDVDPTKIELSTCVQKLSIEHLGAGSANPLAYNDNTAAEYITHKYLNIKSSSDALLGPENYIVSSFHHSATLDSGLCELDSSAASYGSNQDSLINALGNNGFRQSICSDDFSQSLTQFAHKFIKDQNRTFTIKNFKQGAQIVSLKIADREFVNTINAYRLSGNKLIVGEGFIKPNDKIELIFRYPIN